MKNPLSIATAATFLVMAGCDRKTVVVEMPPATPLPEPMAKTKTLETARLGDTVDEFMRNPTAENDAEAKKAFAKLDGELAKLEEYIANHDGEQRAAAAGKLENMKEYRAAQFARFTAAEVKAPVSQAPPVDTRSGAEKLEASARKAGSAIEDTARDAGDKIKDSAQDSAR